MTAARIEAKIAVAQSQNPAARTAAGPRTGPAAGANQTGINRSISTNYEKCTDFL